MNAKVLLYIGLPLALLAMLYLAVKPEPTPEIAVVAPAPGTTPPTTHAPAPSAPAAPEAPVASADPYSAQAPVASADPYSAQAPVAAPSVQPPATAAPAAPDEPKPLTFALVARNNKLVSGPAVIKVQKGDEVTIAITSDKADKLHLHGYDLHADLAPGKTATLKFKANLTGRFTYELHRADVELGAIEVFPR